MLHGATQYWGEAYRIVDRLHGEPWRLIYIILTADIYQSIVRHISNFAAIYINGQYDIYRLPKPLMKTVKDPRLFDLKVGDVAQRA